MLVRPYEVADLEQVKAIHDAQGFDYRFPDIGTDPLFLVNQVVEDGQVRAACSLRLEASTYLWLDPKWSTPQERWTALQVLQSEVRAEARAKGLDSMTAVIPPELEKRFAKRLTQLGWSKDRPWPKWSMEL